MIYRIICLLFVFGLLSCSDDDKRQVEIARDLKKKESVFNTIDKAWHFNTGLTNETSAALFKSWNEWRILLGELEQKPKSTIGAFRTKSKTLSLKAKELNRTIPVQFARPEIKSRVAVLQTKINALNLYMNLSNIPDQKVVSLISDINTEVNALQTQMGEIVRRSQIRKEEGEADMLRMLDTARAIPTNPNPQTEPTPDKKLQMRQRAAAVKGLIKE